MPEFLYAQANFSSGVLSGGGESSYDITQYTQAVAVGTNVSITPLGKLRVRSGIKLLFHYPESRGVNLSNFRVFETTAGNLVFYYSLMSEDPLTIADNNEFFYILDSHTSILASNNPLITSPSVYFYHNQDTVFICYENYLAARYIAPNFVGAFLTYKTIIRYTQKASSSSVPVDYTYEKIGAPWGDSNYPRAITYYNDRLMFAIGNKIYGSAVGEFLGDENKKEVVFRRAAQEGEVVMHNNQPLTITIDDIGDTLPTDSLETTLSGRSNALIFDMQSNQGFYAFTNDGAYYTPEALLEPGKFVLQAITTTSMKDVLPVEVQESYMFVRDSHNAPEAVIDLIQTFQGESYSFSESEVSLFISEHLKDIIRLVVCKGNDKDTQEIMYGLEADGMTIHALHINRSQKVFAWTQYEFTTRIFWIDSFENRLFLSSSNFIYELNGDNSNVPWEVITLRPIVSDARKRHNSQISLIGRGWRIIRAYIEMRNFDVPVYINDKPIINKRLGVTTDSDNGSYEVIANGIHTRGRQATKGIPKGIKISGVGGNNLIIDQININIQYG